MITCKIKVVDKEGRVTTYEGLFRSTMDAVMDALDKFGINKISVVAL